MHIVCEALGLTLPGSAPVLANSPAMFESARRSGARIVEMVWQDLQGHITVQLRVARALYTTPIPPSPIRDAT